MVLVSGNRITETDHPPQLKLVNKFGNLNSIKLKMWCQIDREGW